MLSRRIERDLYLRPFVFRLPPRFFEDGWAEAAEEEDEDEAAEEEEDEEDEPRAPKIGPSREAIC